MNKLKGPFFQHCKSLIAGWFLALAVESLYRVIVGKDAYMESVQSGWIGSSLTVPVSFGFVVLAACLFLSAYQQSVKSHMTGKETDSVNN